MTRRSPRRRRSGVSLLEMVSSLTILAVIAAATVGLYWSGQNTQRLARSYSEAQTDIRSALRQMTRTLRTAETILAQGTSGTLNGIASNGYQVVFRLRSSAGSPIEGRYYVSNGVLYQQTSAQAAPGTELARDVVSLTFNYYRTLAGMRSSVNANPSLATEVEINLRVRNQRVTTGLTAYVTLRWKLTG